MPTPYWREHHYPGKRYRLKDAADDALLVVVTCNLCHRAVHYLAADLVSVLDPGRDAHAPPFPCSRCGHARYVGVKLRSPESGDYGHLSVKRPAGVKTIWLWRTVKLGD
jgi:hypothetical protein